MTIICALRVDDGVWIGADGRISERGDTICDEYPKWRQTRKGLWWATSGSIRLYTLVEETPDWGKDIINCRTLCECLRKLAIEDEWAKDEDEKGSSVDYDFDALATDGREIIRFCGDGSFVRHRKTGDFPAYGSGRAFSMGAISAMRATQYSLSEDDDCQEIVENALNAACDFDQSCGGTLFIKKVQL